MDDATESATADKTAEPDDKVELFTLNGEPVSFDDNDISIAGLLQGQRLKRDIAKSAGLLPQPMMRQVKDDLNRVGYAYEGEKLLAYVKAVKNGWDVVHGPASPTKGKTEFHDVSDYETALRGAFELARGFKPGSRTQA